MPIKKVSAVSLALLLITYITVGRLLSEAREPWFAWVIITLSVLLLAALLSSPRSRFRNISRFFKSDTRTFFFIVVAAFLSVVVLWRLHVFVHALIAISAAILVKLEAQAVRLTNGQIFWLIVIVSLTGLGLGSLLQKVVSLTL